MKVYDGLTDYVASDAEAERVRRTLYRSDASARAVVLPAYRARLDGGDCERFRDQGYLRGRELPAHDIRRAHDSLRSRRRLRRLSGLGHGRRRFQSEAVTMTAQAEVTR